MMNVSCDQCETLLADSIEDALADDQRMAFELHVASCPHCARLVRDYEAIPALVRALTDCGAPDDVRIRLQRLLAAARKMGG
ncbi:MAG: zf-HC2 domain-containing protein [Polyangiaceae bacterium]|jgi:anti-sigma factor RsiW